MESAVEAGTPSFRRESAHPVRCRSAGVRWTRLVELHLGNNLLDGELPPKWSAMTQLQAIYLYGQPLHASTPPRMGGHDTSLPNSTLTAICSAEALPRVPFPAGARRLGKGHSYDFTSNRFSGRLKLPCLRMDPCSREWRKRLDETVLSGNELCDVCAIPCSCLKTPSTICRGTQLGHCACSQCHRVLQRLHQIPKMRRRSVPLR